MMVGFDTLLTIASLSLWVLMLGFLYRRFKKSGTEGSYALLAAIAITLGLLLAIPGLLHTMAVVGSALRNNKAYDLRLVWLITLGLLLMHAGLVNVVLSRWIRRAERWAVGMAAAVTALLLAFLLVLHPAADQTVLIIINGTYLTMLVWRVSHPSTALARAV
ncbi:MAG: hypothetical protein ACRENP_12945 [Longimicrobiales bacterium]